MGIDAGGTPQNVMYDGHCGRHNCFSVRFIDEREAFDVEDFRAEALALNPTGPEINGQPVLPMGPFGTVSGGSSAVKGMGLCDVSLDHDRCIKGTLLTASPPASVPEPGTLLLLVAGLLGLASWRRLSRRSG